MYHIIYSGYNKSFLVLSTFFNMMFFVFNFTIRLHTKISGGVGQGTLAILRYHGQGPAKGQAKGQAKSQPRAMPRASQGLGQGPAKDQAKGQPRARPRAS